MEPMAMPRPERRTILAVLIGAALLLPASPVLGPFVHSPIATHPGGAVTSGVPTWSQAQLQMAQRSLHAGPRADRSIDPLVSVASSGPHLGWNNLSSEASPGPSSRFASAMTWDGADGYVLLYGGLHVGSGPTYTVMADTWSYLNGTWRNLSGTVTGSPPPLAAASIVYSPTDHDVLMFGGSRTTGVGADLATTWVYRAGTWTNLTGSLTSAPSARQAAAIVFDSTDGNIVLYGGQANAGNLVQDTWTFHGGAWTNISTTAPTSARLYLPRIADDPADHGVLMFGVDSFNPTYGSPFRPATFLLSGGTWHNLTPTLPQEPPMVYVGGLVYLGPSAGIILFTGVLVDGSGAFERGSVVWQYLGGVWTNLTNTLTADPGGLELPGWAPTPEGAIVVFGGVPNGAAVQATPFTWVLSSVPTVGVVLSKSVIDVGQSVTASSTVAGGVDPIFFSWSLGDGGTGTGPAVTHSYAAVGLYIASVTVTDLVAHLETGSAAVQVNPAPTVGIVVAPSSVHSGTGATFVAVVAGGTAPFTYAWTLGDGSTAATGYVNHTYSSTGTESVTVQVTDAAGQTVTASTSVSVGSPTTAVNLTSGTGLGLLIGVIVLAVVAVAFAVMWIRARTTRPPPTPPPSVSGGP